ncbi:MAG: hypothetical protein HN509_11180 [Halobacteriovoraceae bacterium]|nr:hypothetical protein [Halobacteriovoraceae bacterium]
MPVLVFLFLCQNLFAANMPLDPFFSNRGVESNNRDYADLFQKLGPLLKERIKNELVAALTEGLGSGGKAKKITVLEIKGFDFDLQKKPLGMKFLNNQEVEIRGPLEDSWNMRLVARVRMKWGFIRNTDDFTIKIKKLRIKTQIRLENTEEGLARLTIIKKPKIKFRLSVNASELGNKVLVKLASPIVKLILKKKIKKALAETEQTMLGISKEGYRPYGLSNLNQETLDYGDMDPMVRNIDRKILAINAPFGIVSPTMTKSEANTSWLEAFSPGGPGAGERQLTFPGGDSAIWTGHFLGGLAMKHKLLKDQETLAQVKRVLWGIEKLLQVNGGSGLLARAAAPLKSPTGQHMLKEGSVYARQMIDGEIWVGTQGGNGISRDQYSGVFFGLISAHDFVNDAEVKKTSARLLMMMLDYIIGTGWFITEDRRSFSIAKGKSSPTFWTGINYQRLTFLLMGEQVSPGKYTHLIEKYNDLVYSAALPIYLAVLDPAKSYYKFNLQSTNFYSYFRLEKDPVRREVMLNCIKLLENYVGHHKNVWLDMVRSIALGNRDEAFMGHIRQNYKLALRRGHRMCAPKSLVLTRHPTTTVNFPSTPIEVTPYVLDPDQRHFTTNFMWQRDPFTAGITQGCDPKHESVGLGMTVPYWMGRVHGIFKR